MNHGWCVCICVLCESLICDLFGGAEIWLDWLKDEIRVTEDESDREKVYELSERAVKDYVCKCAVIIMHTLTWI